MLLELSNGLLHPGPDIHISVIKPYGQPDVTALRFTNFQVVPEKGSCTEKGVTRNLVDIVSFYATVDLHDVSRDDILFFGIYYSFGHTYAYNNLLRKKRRYLWAGRGSKSTPRRCPLPRGTRPTSKYCITNLRPPILILWLVGRTKIQSNESCLQRELTLADRNISHSLCIMVIEMTGSCQRFISHSYEIDYSKSYLVERMLHLYNGIKIWLN